MCYDDSFSIDVSNITSNACGVPHTDFQNFENHFGKFPKHSDDNQEKKMWYLYHIFIFSEKYKKGSGTFPTRGTC